MPEPTITDALRAKVARHGEVVATGDQRAILADFRPDRVGQLVAAALLPEDLVGSEVLSLEPRDDGMVEAHICYTAADGTGTVLRSRWVELEQGWRVSDVRNVPDSPPDLGRQGPSDDGLDLPHWEGLRDGRLLIQQCTECRTWLWTPKVICPRCHSWDLAWPEVEPTGELFSWTRTWQPFDPAVRGHLPYVIALVALPQAGDRRLLGGLRDGDSARPSVGAKVSGVITSTPGGWPLLQWELS